MWTYIPTKGYDASLLLGGTPGLVVYIVIASLWTTFVLVVALLPLRYRNSPAYIHRYTGLSLLSLPAPLIAPHYLFYRLLISTDITCYWDIWCWAIATTPTLTMNLARLLRIMHVYRIKQALLDVANLESSSFGQEHAIPIASKAGRHRYSFGERKASVPVELQGEWWYKYRALLTTKSITAIAIAILAITFLLLGVAQAIHGPYPVQPYAYAQCHVDWPNWVAYAITTMIKSVLFPAVVIFLRDVEDSYGIRQEFKIYGSINSLVSIVFFIVIWIPNMVQIARTIIIFVISIVYLANGIYITYYLPLRDIIHADRQAKSILFSRESFEYVLTNTESFREFLFFSLRDFSIECPLFYKRYTQLALVHSPLPSSARVSSDSEVLGESASPTLQERESIRVDLIEVYVTFLEDGSPYQLNVSSVMIDTVKRELSANICNLAVLDPILRDVKNMMFHNTYPRFLAWYKPTDPRAFSAPTSPINLKS